MGTTQHHVVIASTWSDEIFQQAKKWAARPETGGTFVASLPAPINGEQTLIMLPDGSNEGWPQSDAGDAHRQVFIKHLESYSYEDGSNPWKFVEVGYGELGSRIEHTNCIDRTKPVQA